MLSLKRAHAARASVDFETYSEAGYVLRSGGKWGSARKSGKGGIFAVGAWAYATHPTAEVLSISYDLKDGLGLRLWTPHTPATPDDLITFFLEGGTAEAWNDSFEFYVWNYILARRHGFPATTPDQWHDVMDMAQGCGLPASLAKAGEVLGIEQAKSGTGKDLIQFLSCPRSATKHDKRLRNMPRHFLAELDGMYQYNLQDVRAQDEIRERLPELTSSELTIRATDSRINKRGVAIDVEGLERIERAVAAEQVEYNARLRELTDGAVTEYTETKALTEWTQSQLRGTVVSSLDADSVDALLKMPLRPDVLEVLNIRKRLNYSSVKKTDAIKRRLSLDTRLRDIFAYCGAAQTGRWAGRGPQPQNLPGSGPLVMSCECGAFFGFERDACPTCGAMSGLCDEQGWSPEAADYVLSNDGFHGFDLKTETASGCLRGLFIADEGRDLICSDYSAIEAVGLACLAGEQWRIDVFKGDGLIYERTAAKLSGKSFDEIMEYKRQTGEHHPLRKKLGKVAELASGYAGWIGAWMNFGAGSYFTTGEGKIDEKAMKSAILKWREDSPAIVEFWGGQQRKHPNRWEFTPELFGLEGHFIKACLHPGERFHYRGMTFQLVDGSMELTLLSGRKLYYHDVELIPDTNPWSKLSQYKISFWGLLERKEGGGGKWARKDTYGGRLCENVVQATCRDIMAHAMANADAAGYSIVLHVHDEPVAEVPKGWGSVEEFERIMCSMPEWCRGWPIRADGGWRGRRYRKD